MLGDPSAEVGVMCRRNCGGDPDSRKTPSFCKAFERFPQRRHHAPMLSFRMTEPRTSRAFAVLAGALLAYLLWRILSPFLEPILWAAVLAFLLGPGHQWLLRRVKSENLAAVLATGLAFLLVVVPAVLLTLALISQGAHLYSLASDYLARHKVASISDIVQMPAIRKVADRIATVLPLTAEDLRGWAQTNLKTIAGRVGGVISGLAVGVLGFVASFLIMLFTLFFLFRDGRGLWRRLVAAVPLEQSRTSFLVRRLESVLQAVLAGTLLTAILQGLLGGIGFAIFGLPSPVVFGAMMAVLSLLPVGGTAFVWLPAAIALVAQGSWGRGVGLAAWGLLIVGLADNWFKPMIISGRSDLNTLPVFFGVLGGLAAFGFLGLFVGPLVIALGITAWETATAAVPADGTARGTS